MCQPDKLAVKDNISVNFFIDFQFISTFKIISIAKKRVKKILQLGSIVTRSGRNKDLVLKQI